MWHLFAKTLTHTDISLGIFERWPAVFSDTNEAEKVMQGYGKESFFKKEQ